MRLIIRKEMSEHISSIMHVFRGEKYRLLLRGGPPQGTAKETVKDTTLR